MLRNKILAVGLSFVVAASLLIGCGTTQETSTQPDTETTGETSTTEETSENTNTEEASNYEDGIYFAQEDGFSEKSGWKYVVTVEVKDGKIVKADWNGAHKDGGTDKKTRSKSGDYGMVANGGAQAEWHEQAKAAEDYLLEIQEPTAINYTDDEGHTDAISGVSIHVSEFFNLANKALDNGPVGEGPYKDGAYHAEEKAFSEKSGWKYTADLTVINGYIVAADWDGVHKDGGDTKDVVSENGDYGMVANGGAQSEWHEQAEAAEVFLLENQDPTAIKYSDDEGHTDAISGVSIHVIEFFNLAQQALEDAR